MIDVLYDWASGVYSERLEHGFICGRRKLNEILLRTQFGITGWKKNRRRRNRVNLEWSNFQFINRRYRMINSKPDDLKYFERDIHLNRIYNMHIGKVLAGHFRRRRLRRAGNYDLLNIRNLDTVHHCGNNFISSPVRTIYVMLIRRKITHSSRLHCTLRFLQSTWHCL